MGRSWDIQSEVYHYCAPLKFKVLLKNMQIKVIIRVSSRFNLDKLSLKITELSLKVLFRDYGWVNLPNNPEMISRMYRKWKS